ncbi:TonB-dependent receptor family protein [Phenylobacterium kunshanense]|uniref:TonB-dependent receptor n=1 Tax=Phenylobacterium kunshanense TaxID=1445034 RepID=A0A328BMJ3_9CAUL|nr:TonB-dependent receptor [Phenylobacterium kunshanense]RAK67206.1 TonB-dependent receptor [Phenylobacterium kunshanense]
MRTTLRALLLAACAAPTGALAADEAANTVDSVIVTGVRNPEDPPVVQDARQRLSETPGAVSVISQESYERRFAVALDDVLRDAPGVYVQKKWGGDLRISIRGSGIGNANHNRGLLIAQDGVPLNEADGYGDSQIADPLNTRFTEVYRGGNALRFGGALLGGAINMVAPTGRTAGFENRLRIDGGSFGLLREHLAVARQHGDWDLYAAATNQTGQGWRPQSQQNIQFGTLNIGRAFGDDREFRLVVNGSNIAQEIPGALTRAQFDANPRQATAGNYANDQGRNQRGVRTSLRSTWRLNETTVFEGAVYGVWKDLDHPIFQVIDQESRNYGAFGRLDWQGELGGRRADAYAGLWLRAGDLDSNFYVNVKGARGAPTSRTRQNAEAIDAFAEGRLFVADRLALVGGATWGRATRDYQQYAIPGVGSTFNLKASKDYDWLAPRIGVLWEGEDGIQVFANLTKSVEPPNNGSLSPTGTGFAPVKAQQAWTAEVGTRGRHGPFLWDITFYRAWLDRELLQYTVSADRPASTFNADETIHQGVEAALDWQVGQGLRLRQAWTWSDFRFRNDSQYFDNRLPIVPEHVYRAELRYEHPAGWWVAPTVEWSASDVWVDFANTTKAPSYAIWGLGAGYRVNERVALFVDARNLADKAYISNVQAQIRATAASAAYWPGDGRSVFGGVTWTF